MRVLVVGGAGYIGCHTVRALQAAGHQPVVYDSLIHGHRDLVEDVLQVPLVVARLEDREQLEATLAHHHVEAVLHFAASTNVGESVADPLGYYRNNAMGSLVLLQALAREAGRRGSPLMPLVFSSTCATYGQPEQVPITEACPQQPINPYGRSKLMVEWMIRDFAVAHGLPAVIFRYFNAAGADPAGDLGEDHSPETHLVPRLLQTIGGWLPESFAIYGDDYPTADGTCVRDYIHVSDLATAHVLGLDACVAATAPMQEPLVYNLGTGRGFSVQEVIAAAEQVTGQQLQVTVAPRRPGDPPVLVAGAEKARRELGWCPRFTDLQQMVGHAWTWHQRRHSRQVA